MDEFEEKYDTFGQPDRVELYSKTTRDEMTEETFQRLREKAYTDDQIEDIKKAVPVYTRRRDMLKKFEKDNGRRFIRLNDNVDDLKTIYSKNSKFYKKVIEEDYEGLAQRQYAQD